MIARLCFLLLLASGAVQAQVRLAPGSSVAPLDTALDIVADTGQTLDEVIADSTALQPTSTLYPTSETPEAYWGRVRLISEATETVEWILPLSVDRVTAVLVRSDGTRDVSETGRLLPLNQRTVPLAHPPVVQIRLAAGELATLYLRVRQRPHTYAPVMEPRPVEARAFASAQRRTDLTQAAFLGVLFGLAFYNLFLFAMLRDRSYLYYVIVLVGAMVYWATLQGYIVQYLWPQDVREYHELNFLGLVVAGASYSMFVRAFLQTRRFAPRLHYVLLGVVAGWGLSGLLGLLGQWYWGPLLAAVLALFLLSSTFLAGVQAHRAGFRPARYFLIASGAFIVTGLVYAVLYFVNPTLQVNGRFILQMGMLMEVLLLALALSVRVRILDRERRDAIQAQVRAEARSRELREADTLKTRLLGIAAHDLRSPLTGIIGFSDLIEDETPERSDVHELTSIIRRNADRMLGLVEDLLVTAALDGGRLELNREVTDIGALLLAVVEDYEQRIDAKRQRLALQVPEPSPEALVDPDRFRAILDNLVSNAVKYTPTQGAITISCASGESHISISVQDSGPGLSAADQDDLFQRFRPLTAAPTGGETATGLGLSIAHQLAELHGGNIEVESSLGEGATFTVVVPLAPEARVGATEREAELQRL